MIYHYKVVVDAIRACLDEGFNAEIASAAVIYGFPQFSIKFADGSPNFVTDYVDASDIEKSDLREFPGMAIYTTGSQDGVPSVIHGVQFSGQVIANVDFYYRDRGGVGRSKADDQLSAAEGAIRALFAAYTWPVNAPATVKYSRRVSAQKSRQIPLKDGYGQALSLQAPFGVVIP